MKGHRKNSERLKLGSGRSWGAAQEGGCRENEVVPLSGCAAKRRGVFYFNHLYHLYHRILIWWISSVPGFRFPALRDTNPRFDSGLGPHWGHERWTYALPGAEKADWMLIRTQLLRRLPSNVRQLNAQGRTRHLDPYTRTNRCDPTCRTSATWCRPRCRRRRPEPSSSREPGRTRAPWNRTGRAGAAAAGTGVR